MSRSLQIILLTELHLVVVCPAVSAVLLIFCQAALALMAAALLSGAGECRHSFSHALSVRLKGYDSPDII
jgi:hypothetical protein